MEVLTWSVDDPGRTLGDRLANLTVELDEALENVARQLEPSGLRLVRMRRDDLIAAIELAPPVDTLNRRWLKPESLHRTVAIGRPSEGEQLVLLAGEPVELDAGDLRLVGRVWPAPSVDGALGPTLRAEIAAQLSNDRPNASAPPGWLLQPRLRGALERGDLFAELSIDARLDPRFAYLLVPEAPGARWTPSAMGPAPDPAEPAEAFDPAAGEAGASNDDASYGPAVQLARTLGEAMLSAPADHAAHPHRRTVVALLPRLPERYTLFPGIEWPAPTEARSGSPTDAQ
jgi:hypothetical protein